MTVTVKKTRAVITLYCAVLCEKILDNVVNTLVFLL